MNVLSDHNPWQINITTLHQQRVFLIEIIPRCDRFNPIMSLGTKNLKIIIQLTNEVVDEQFNSVGQKGWRGENVLTYIDRFYLETGFLKL